MKKTDPNSPNSQNSVREVEPVFARHETFHPRYGWLKKGYDEATRDPDVFLREDAPVRLGVGKNMVRSIRYWCSAFKVLAEEENGKQKSRRNVPSELGTKLLGDGGWDPFLEDPASLWWLHWNLLKPTCEAAAWYFAFHRFRQAEFSMDDFLRELDDFQNFQLGGSKIAFSSLKKDATCILRMYAPTDTESGAVEDSVNCPFAELGIMGTGGNAKTYNFRVGAKENLPAEVVVAACLEFAGWRGQQKSIALSTLTYDPGSPGLAFKLTESAIADAIDRVAVADNVSIAASLGITDTAGLIQFYYDGDPVHLSTDILEGYYKRNRFL